MDDRRVILRREGGPKYVAGAIFFNEFNLSQIRVLTGSFENNLNTMEARWQVLHNWHKYVLRIVFYPSYSTVCYHVTHASLAV